MKRIYVVLAALLLFLAFAGLVSADEGKGGEFIFGRSYVLGPGEELSGDLVVLGGTAHLEEKSLVRGNVVVMGGSVTVAGRVTGDVTVLGGSVHLTSTAVVNGEVISVGGSINREPGAMVDGQVVEGFRMPRGYWKAPYIPLRVRGWPNTLFNLVAQIVRAALTLLALMALGVLVVLTLPMQTERVAQTIMTAPAVSIGVGLLTFIVLPILLVVLVITCVGPLILGLAAGIATLFGWIAVGLVVGQKILEALKAKEYSILIAVVLGIAVITFLAELPCLGWLFILLGGSLGLGAVILTRFGTVVYPWPSSTASSSASGSLSRPTEPGESGSQHGNE